MLSSSLSGFPGSCCNVDVATSRSLVDGAAYEAI
jgi:hypothetical protein